MSENQKQVVVHEFEFCENTYSLLLWTLAAIVVLTLILSIGNYNNHKNEALVEMTKNGTPAMEASCAIQGTSNSSCIILNTSKAVEANSRR